VIRKVDPNGVISTVVGTGTPGFNGDGVGTGVEITRVFGLMCSGAALLFSDSDSGLIRYFDGTGNVITIWHGFYFPVGLAYDSQGALYVADGGTNVVWRLDYSTGVRIVAGGGAGCPTPPAQCVGTDAALNQP